MLQNDPLTKLPPFHLDAGPDPGPAFHFEADPDPLFHFDADPDPAIQNDPDPQHCLEDSSTKQILLWLPEYRLA
jgi:hypothetical protein